MIDQRQIERIKKMVAREFPEFKGIEPKIVEREIKPQYRVFKKLDLGVPKQLKHIYQMQYKKTIETEDHISIERILTITLDEKGEIIKITESR